MREIIFRGKRIDNGEWVEGKPWIFAPPVDKAVIVYAMGLVGEDDGVSRYCECHEVDPKSVSEFTGLTDKNGKKIFEGDIILVDFDGFPVCKREVSFNQDVSAYVLWNGTKSNFYRMSEAPKKYSKIIGNIHDNPELLGGDKK